MTEIEKEALEYACECAGRTSYHYRNMGLDLPLRASITAHARTIEQHEAFKQEVSDAVGEAAKGCGHDGLRAAYITSMFNRFIIAKPDPLVEVLYDFGSKVTAAELRQALAARGLKIVEQIADLPEVGA